MNCAFIDNILGCRILEELVCSYKHCSFFMSQTEYDRFKDRDYLHESYEKGNIDRKRYIELFDRYHSKI